MYSLYRNIHRLSTLACLYAIIKLQAHDRFKYDTGFNGPSDRGFAGVSSTNSPDPLTLSQATKWPDWPKWEEAIQ